MESQAKGQPPAVKQSENSQLRILKRSTSQSQKRPVPNRDPLMPKKNQNIKDLTKASCEVDDIGVRLTCRYCNNLFYYFQIADHCEQCSKKTQQNQKIQQLQRQKQAQKQQNSIRQKQIEIVNSKKDQINQDQKLQIISRLQNFNIEKQRVSKLISVHKSKIGIKQFNPHPDDVLTQIPCPFCGIELKLQDLDHIDSCQMSSQCKYCKDKFPKILKSQHDWVCTERLPKRKALRTTKRIEDAKPDINIIQQYMYPEKKLRKNLINDTKQQDIKISPPKKRQEIRPKQQKQKGFVQPFERYIPARLHTQKNYHHRPQRQIDYFKDNYIHPQINIREQQRNSTQQFDPALLDDKSRIRAQKMKGIPKQQLKKLKKIRYDQNNFENQTQCNICTFPFQDNEIITQLKCPHIFHENCLAPWFQNHTTCPVCKTQVTI